MIPCVICYVDKTIIQKAQTVIQCAGNYVILLTFRLCQSLAQRFHFLVIWLTLFISL